MNKKGEETFSIGTYLIYFLVAVFILLFMVMFYLTIFSKIKYQTLYASENLQEDLLIQRFTHSTDCFVYFDYEINRAYPNLIDWQRFSEEQLNNCLSHKNIGFKLTLKNLENNEEKTITTSNWRDSVKRGLTRSVLIKDDKLYKGSLNIQIQK